LVILVHGGSANEAKKMRAIILDKPARWVCVT
jgi:hypothetical protein